MSAPSTLRLVIAVRFHQGRYHGRGDWPPSPARLFQAIIAGVGLRGPLPERARTALRWFESLDAPTIAAPKAKRGEEVTLYVPKNDLDAPGSRVEMRFDVLYGPHLKWFKSNKGIRDAKRMQPILFDEETPILYGWSFQKEDYGQADEVCELAECLYRLGHGIDMAWAEASVLQSEEFHERIAEHPGRLYRPTDGTGGTTLPYPQPGSLDGLVARYNGNLERFRSDGGTRTLQQPSPVRFAQVAYNSPAVRRLFEVREGPGHDRFVAWPLGQATRLVSIVRDGVIEQLVDSFPEEGVIDKAFYGEAGSEHEGREDSTTVKIIPIPSIGHPYADRDIRRLLVEVPPNCPIPAHDIFWAFSGYTLDPGEGLESDAILERVRGLRNDNMLGHYGVLQEPGFTIWRTQTPAALPESARRRRIDPDRVDEESKPGSERLDEEMNASKAIVRELRTTRLYPQLRSIRVQREPFETNGKRVERFSEGSGFEKERIWHVEIEFEEEVSGPLVIGEGRFDGLGVMAPVRGGRD